MLVRTSTVMQQQVVWGHGRPQITQMDIFSGTKGHREEEQKDGGKQNTAK